jgi:hypothetical protein
MLEFIFDAVKIGITIFIAGLTIYFLYGIFILVVLKIGNHFYK